MHRHLLAALALSLFALPASSQQVGDVVVFGDSLSDPGNVPGLSGGVNFPPSPPYADNRFSNGPVYSELLPSLLGGTFDPSLNFAVGGALTAEDNLNSNRASALPGSDLTGVTLPGIGTQVDGFVGSGGRLDDDDLVIVYGGANDIFVAAAAAAGLPEDQIPDLVTSTAETAANEHRGQRRQAERRRRFLFHSAQSSGPRRHARLHRRRHRKHRTRRRLDPRPQSGARSNRHHPCKARPAPISSSSTSTAYSAISSPTPIATASPTRRMPVSTFSPALPETGTHKMNSSSSTASTRRLAFTQKSQKPWRPPYARRRRSPQKATSRSLPATTSNEP